jgi:Protein of unknown function (DUF559)
MSDEAIERALRRGSLHRVFRAVYAVGTPRAGDRPRMMAAVLACGPGTLVSHRSAAALLGLIDRAPLVVDVIAPGQHGRGIDGIRAHTAPRPRHHETGSVELIPCTDPARTLVDLASTSSLRTLEGAFERAAAKGLLDLGAVEAAIRPRQRGAVALRQLIARWRPAAEVANEPLRSVLEAKVLPLLGRRDLPMPRANAGVALAEGSVEVDFLWEAERLVLEADSREFHATEVAFERDRWRDRELMRVGYSTLRVTRKQVETEAGAVADAIASRLS